VLAGVDPLVFVGAVLLLLLAGLSWLTRRVQAGALGGGGGSRARVVLTNQHAVHLIEVGGKRLLVGTGPSGAPRVLVELGDVTVVEPAPEPVRPWAWLGMFGRVEVGSGR
jgi:flagellar biogenesis protein FliO